MNLTKKIILFSIIVLLTSCANYKIDKSAQKKEKKYYSSNGFALIYEDALFEKGVVNKKLNNKDLIVMHSTLKKNTPIKITNPESLKVIETKVFKRADYPMIFNILISQKAAQILELDVNNPYVKVSEVKKNMTFIAKEGEMFEEEKQVAETAPVDEIKMDDLTNTKLTSEKKLYKKNNFSLVISDFYYSDSAYNLKKELEKNTGITNFSVKKINNNQYRLYAGPYENFNSLKSIYISLNNLGFEDLNIYNK